MRDVGPCSPKGCILGTPPERGGVFPAAQHLGWVKSRNGEYPGPRSAHTTERRKMTASNENLGPECYQCKGAGCAFCDDQGRVESFDQWLERKNPATLGSDGANDGNAAGDCR